MAWRARAQAERLLAGQDLRVQRWLKMLRFKDTEGRRGFRCDDFVELAAKLFPAARPEALAIAHATAAGADGTAPLDGLAATLAYMEAATLATPQ